MGRGWTRMKRMGADFFMATKARIILKRWWEGWPQIRRFFEKMVGGWPGRLEKMNDLTKKIHKE
ncbi:hypothetical protein ACSVH7_14620 [Flavobacterium sp. TSSA_36]